MAIELDHVILATRDPARSIAFYSRILGLTHEGNSQPFSTVRVTPGFVILLARSDTAGGEHLAFSLTQTEFDAAFARLKEDGIPYGDRFDSVGGNAGPSDEDGARGVGKAVYFFDPDRHLIEIRHYGNAGGSPKDVGAYSSLTADGIGAGSVAVGAQATGALAIGAVAVAAFVASVAAIGAISVGVASLFRLTIAEAKVERLDIGELTVGKLTIRE